MDGTSCNPDLNQRPQTTLITNSTLQHPHGVLYVVTGLGT
jgi:hypothetical protein